MSCCWTRVAEKYLAINAHHLRRITVIELPGWGPALSGVGDGSPLRNYKLKSARFVPAEAHRPSSHVLPWIAPGRSGACAGASEGVIQDLAYWMSRPAPQVRSGDVQSGRGDREEAG